MLRTFHRVLIGAAITLCLLFCSWSIVQFVDSGDRVQMVVGIFSGAIGIALIYYFRWFSRKNADSSVQK